jgi:hypothetical protein
MNREKARCNRIGRRFTKTIIAGMAGPVTKAPIYYDYKGLWKRALTAIIAIDQNAIVIENRMQPDVKKDYPSEALSMSIIR